MTEFPINTILADLPGAYLYQSAKFNGYIMRWRGFSTRIMASEVGYACSERALTDAIARLKDHFDAKYRVRWR